MNYLNVIKYPLLPILITQGVWAKIKTPRLPEAKGERKGLIGHGKLVKLLILGDSAAAGVGVDHQNNALIGKLLKQFDLEQYQLDWQLHAKNGNTLLDLHDIVNQLPTQKFDIVITSSGVNDIVKQHSLKQWSENATKLYQQLNSKFDSPHILFTQVPPLQYFTALPRTLAWYLGKHATAFDQKIQDLSSQWPSLHHIALALPNQKEYLASDGFHPSELSNDIWAKTIMNYIQANHLL